MLKDRFGSVFAEMLKKSHAAAKIDDHGKRKSDKNFGRI